MLLANIHAWNKKEVQAIISDLGFNFHKGSCACQFCLLDYP
uniref:Uncharacterized protein n=1 Tax=Arundo donax TaxID=35708 RepID=A0A0A9GM82_ARUDO